LILSPSNCLLPHSIESFTSHWSSSPQTDSVCFDSKYIESYFRSQGTLNYLHEICHISCDVFMFSVVLHCWSWDLHSSWQ
jgi:hypothetical protein